MRPRSLLRSSVALLLAVSLASASPLANGEQFQNVKLMVNVGGKAEEQDAVLSLEDESMVVRSKGGTVLKALPYATLKSMEYSYSESPRWKSGAAAAVLVGVFAIPIFFMKGKKHWLTVVSGDQFALLRLDKDNFKIIIPALEARTGMKVDTVADEK